jgi:hypothetical protein
MRKTPRKRADSLKQAAALLNTDLAIVRAAKSSGCPAFQNGRVDLDLLRDWLADVQSRRRNVKKRPAPLDTGLAGSMRRLAESEAQLHADMLNAADPLAATVARKAWLDVAEQLRRADLALESARKDAGELLERTIIEDLLRGVSYAINAAFRQSSQQFQPAAECQRVFQLLSRDYLACVAFSASMPSKLKVPAWAVEALSSTSPFQAPAEYVAKLQAYFEGKQ